MQIHIHETVQVGDLIAAAFDEAESYSSDAREVSRLATRAVTHLLRDTQRALPPPARVAASMSTSLRTRNAHQGEHQ